MRFLFLYLHLFSAIEHVSTWKSALEIRSLLLLLQFAAQWGDSEKSRIAPFNAIIIMILDKQTNIGWNTCSIYVIGWNTLSFYFIGWNTLSFYFISRNSFCFIGWKQFLSHWLKPLASEIGGGNWSTQRKPLVTSSRKCPGTPVATLLGTWRHRVSTGIGWPSASMLWLSGIKFD